MTTTATQKHTIKYWVWTYDPESGRNIRLRHSRHMVGWKGWDATCSCGWETRSGGALQSWIKREVRFHKYFATDEEA